MNLGMNLVFLSRDDKNLYSNNGGTGLEKLIFEGKRGRTDAKVNFKPKMDLNLDNVSNATVTAQNTRTAQLDSSSQTR